MSLLSKLFHWIATINSHKLDGHYPGGQDPPVSTGDTTAPTVPTNIRAVSISVATITMTCDDSSDAVGVTGYQWKRDSTVLTAGVNKNLADAGLTADTLYSYSVRAFDAAGNFSAYSTIVAIRTLPQSVLQWAPGLDTFLELTIGQAFSLNFGTVCASTLGTPTFTKLSGNWPVGVTLTTPTASGTPTTVETPVAIVRAADGVSTADMQFTFEVLAADTTAPAAPANFTAVATGATTCRLDWVNPTDPDVTGARTSGFLGQDIYIDGAKVDRSAVGATSYIVGQTNPLVTVAAGSTHGYSLRSVDVALNKGPFTATISVAQPTTAPGVPSAFTVTANGQTRIDVAWGAPSGGTAPTTYLLEESSNGGTSWATAQNALTPTSFSRTGLTAGSTRSYRVTAYAGATGGQATAVLSATTSGSGLTITTFHYDDMEGAAFDYAKSGDANYGSVRWSGIDDFSTALDTRPTLSTNRARFGTKGVRFQLTNGWPNAANKVNGGTEWPHRNQAKSKAWPTTGYSGNAVIGQEYWYAFSIYLPGAADPFGDPQWVSGPPGSGWEILTQWHDSPDAGTGEISRQPMMSLTTDYGAGGVTSTTQPHTNWAFNVKCQDQAVMTSNTFDRNQWIDLGPFAADTGRWTDWVFRVKWDYNNVGSGILEIWKNASKVWSEVGRGNCYNDVLGPSWDIGIYCGWRTDAAASVAPARRAFYYDEEQMIRVVGNPQAAVDTSNEAYQKVAPRSTGGGGPPSTASNPVTSALNATGTGTRYDVGTGKTYADPNTVPWGSLTAGSVVNIFYRATPYAFKLGLRGQGTAVNPIIVNGVTDANGNRPVFDFANARTAAGCNPGGAANVFTGTPQFGETLGGIVTKRGPSDAYGTYAPKWIQFKNLELKGARNGASYTTLAGGTASYSSSAGLYLLLLEDGLVENCVIYDNGFGVFTMAKDDLYSEACKRVTFRNNRVYGNGVSGSFLEHNFYVQVANPILEGNYIGQTRAGSQGSSYKSRSSGEIFRYNHVVGSARVCDWVHSEDQNQDGIVTQPDYGTDYVYGNVFVNDFNQPNGAAGAGLHYGGDNLGEDDGSSPLVTPSIAYRSHLYFWNNTYVCRATSTQSFRTSIFDLSLVATTCDAWDNLFVVNGSSNFYWVEWAGNLNLRGNNLAFGTIGDARDGSNAARYEVSKLGALFTTDPLLTDLANQDYRLDAGSGALDRSTTPAGMPTTAVLNQPRIATNGSVARTQQGTALDLGALERGVS